jgi:hypothetical protein
VEKSVAALAAMSYPADFYRNPPLVEQRRLDANIPVPPR